MLPNFVNLIAFRLYLDKNIDDIKNIINIKLPRNVYGLVLLCGKQSNLIKAFSKCRMLDDSLILKKGWNVLHIGFEKEGYSLPWFLLFKIVKKNQKIKYFILSDADEQIPFKEVKKLKIDNGISAILPQRRERHFGEFTLERNIIEDIENAFIRLKSKIENIPDFQSGLFVMKRDVVEKVDFVHVRRYKWIGDLYFVEQLLKNNLNIKFVDVDISRNHNSSSIFDYSSPMNEILIGTPILKMKELVDYFGISLKEVRDAMLSNPEAYLPTFFKYSNKRPKNVNSLDEIKSYVEFIISLYFRTADIYNFKL